MQRVRAAVFLLTTFMIAVTAMGMDMMPISTPAVDVHHPVATLDRHHHDSQPGEGHQHSSDDCWYCHLAKATDVSSTNGTVTVHKLLARIAGMQTASFHPPAWALPCQPRAPPPADAA